MSNLAEISRALDLPNRPEDVTDLDSLARKAMYWVIDEVPFSQGSPFYRPEDVAGHEGMTGNCIAQAIAGVALMNKWGVECGIAFDDSTPRHAQDFAVDGTNALRADAMNRNDPVVNLDLRDRTNGRPKAPYIMLLEPVARGESVVYQYLEPGSDKWTIVDSDPRSVRTGEKVPENYCARVFVGPELGTDMLLAISELSALRESEDSSYRDRYDELKLLVPDFVDFPSPDRVNF